MKRICISKVIRTGLGKPPSLSLVDSSSLKTRFYFPRESYPFNQSMTTSNAALAGNQYRLPPVRRIRGFVESIGTRAKRVEKTSGRLREARNDEELAASMLKEGARENQSVRVPQRLPFHSFPHSRHRSRQAKQGQTRKGLSSYRGRVGRLGKDGARVQTTG